MSAETHWRAHDGSRIRLEGLLAAGMRQSGYRVMKHRLLRLLAAVSTLAAAVLAGGASLKGF